MKYIIIACLFIISLCGCTKFLETVPKTFISPSAYLTSDATAQVLLNGVYNAVDGYADPFAKLTPYYLDLASDNCMSVASWQYFTDFPKGQATSTNTYVGLRWSLDYAGISRANYFLAQIANATYTSSNTKRYVAEAKFLRAWFYHDLVKFWGDVPLILVPPVNVGAQPTRSAKASVITQVLKDLNEAIPDLPTAYTGADVGRITKGAALAFDARVLLFNQQWTAAAAAAQSCMGLGYSLYPDYFGLFKQENKDAVTNSEAIFQVFYTASTNPSTANYLMDYSQSYQPTLELVNDYYMSNGLPITNSTSGYDPNNPFMMRDPRLKNSMWYPGAPWTYTPWSISNQIFGNTAAYNVTGFKCRKFINEALTTANEVNGQAMNKMFIRYAEVLLTYAEAQNEAVGPDATVYNAIDALRTRAGVQKISVAMPSLSQAQMRQEIRHERRIELAFEGFRWNDIQRWQIGAQAITTVHGLKGALLDNTKYPGDGNGTVAGSWQYQTIIADTRQFNPAKDYLWPIPQTELDANKNMIQNPNY